MKSCLAAALLLLTLSLGVSAQPAGRPVRSPRDLGFSTLSVNGQLGQVNFVVSDTVLREKKPVFVFCQGSLPYALFLQEDAAHTYQQAIPFDYKKYRKDAYFVVISKPGIPVFTTTADRNYWYVDPVTKKTPDAYFEHDYLDYHVAAANDVLAYLVKQPWVDRSMIVVAGHSQGSKVAAKVSATNKHVTHTVFLAGNPLGRLDQGIRQQRRDALLGQISAAEAQQNIDTLYAEARRMYQHPNTPSQGYGHGDSYRAWTSFSEPLLPYLLKINTPLFVGYGTQDLTADYCDLLPLDFARTGKTNLTLKPYLGCDHSFVRKTLDATGHETAREELFNQVAADIFAWLGGRK